MNPLLTRLRSGHADTRGAVAIEFAFVFPVFIFLFMGIVEYGLVKFGNNVIDNAMSQMARAAMVGCIDNEVKSGECKQSNMMNMANIKTLIAKQSAGFVDPCGGRFTLKIAPVTAAPSGDINWGQGQEVVLYEAEYEWPVFNPLLKMDSFLGEGFGESIHFHVANIVRNEAFGTLSGRTESGGGC